MEVPGCATLVGNIGGHVKTSVNFVYADLAEENAFPRVKPAKASNMMKEAQQGASEEGGGMSSS